HPMRGAQTIADAVAARHVEARAPAADHERRDRDLQPVEQLRFEEPRDRRAAALDEYRPEAAPVQRVEQHVEREPAVADRNADDLGLAVTLAARGERFVDDQQRAGGAVAEDAAIGAEAPPRIEDDADRVRAGRDAHREPRIVRRDGARADDDGVAQRAHALQMQEIRGAGHVERIAARGRDLPVEALAEMRDGERARMTAQRQIQIEHRPALGRRLLRRAPAAAVGDEQAARVVRRDRDGGARAIDAERAAGEPGDVPAVPRQREKHAKRALAFRDRRGLLLVRCSAVQRRRVGSRGRRYREAKARSRPYRCYPSTPVNDSSSTSAVAINGEAAALAVDRAVDELRRGRAIHLAEHGANGHGRGLVVAAVGAVPQSLLERLAATGAPESLLTTPERAPG